MTYLWVMLLILMTIFGFIAGFQTRDWACKGRCKCRKS